MRITFLGTGTSSGVPMIGCDCPVCLSDDPRNKRRRASLYVEAAGQRILVDTPPDFREQALLYRMPRIDAVLFTHAHADHIFGFDDIRRYNRLQEAVIPAYAVPETLGRIRRVFAYIGREARPGFYRPRIDFREIKGAFMLGTVQVTPLPVKHDAQSTHGFRFDSEGRSVAYVPDCAAMADSVVESLLGIDVMILDALRHRPHTTHLTVEQSVALLRRIKAGQSYVTHMCHDLDHEQTRAVLPAGIDVSYDGLVVEW